MKSQIKTVAQAIQCLKILNYTVIKDTYYNKYTLDKFNNIFINFNYRTNSLNKDCINAEHLDLLVQNYPDNFSYYSYDNGEQGIIEIEKKLQYNNTSIDYLSAKQIKEICILLGGEKYINFLSFA